MKKTIITIAIILGLGVSYGYSQTQHGGLFGKGPSSEMQNDRTEGLYPLIPQYGESHDSNAPIGSGIALMLGLSGAYLLSKKRREE